MAKTKYEAGLLASCVLGGAAGIVITLLLLFGAAALISGGVIPAGLGEELMIVSSFVGSALGAFLAIKKRGKSALSAGLVSGVCYLIIMLIIVASQKGTGVISGMALSAAICALASGAFAAAISSRPKSRKSGYSRR